MWKYLLLTAGVIAFSGCGLLEDAVDEKLEQEAGCSDSDLGALKEPDLPNCTKAVACCKFIKGECGEITLFDPPTSVITACNANEAILSTAIGEYQGLQEGDCPDFMTSDSCSEGLESTKANYVRVVDGGDTTMSQGNAPSCQLIVEETIVPLNDSLGSAAKFLPEACEAP